MSSFPWIDSIEASVMAGERVCETCFLVYNGHLPVCSYCELHTPKVVTDDNQSSAPDASDGS